MSKKIKLTENDKISIIEKYNNEIISIDKLALIYHAGKKTIRDILINSGVKIRERGGQIQEGNSSEIEKNRTKLYVTEKENQELIAICKKTNKKFNDVNNLSGCLTNHIIEIYGDVNIPSNTYQRKKYELKYGKKWFEEYFDIVYEDNKKELKCELCEWITYDVNNSTGSITKHINDKHQLNVNEYINKFPHTDYLWENKINLLNKLKDDDNSVICLECNNRFLGLTDTHMINEHNMTLESYKIKWGNLVPIFSNNTTKILSDNIKNTNLNMVNNFTSKPQLEIYGYIKNELGVECELNNKKVLNGIELDIFIPNKNIAIEYNGLYYHCENMGKNKYYHLNKSELASSKNIKLIHIFEDEWRDKKYIVKLRIRNLLGLNNKSYYARKCKIKEISTIEKDEFLNQYHIEGGDESSIRLGAFINEELVGVMTFSKLRKVLGYKNENNNEYEMVRFTSKSVIGLASKFLKYFKTNYDVNKIISYADRRWSPISDDCIYNKLGFDFIGSTKPNYWYLRNYKYREHRFNFRKDILVKKGADKNKTENQIMSELGYEKIWDCGTFKYSITF